MSSRWNELTAHTTPALYQRIINIDDSLWYATSYSHGEKGMVEYCIKTNKIKQIVKYPINIQPNGHRICEYHKIIYIIDGAEGRIISFDVSTRQFKTKLQIPKIGIHPCCLVITDKIHIFNGKNNQKHLIYSIAKNQIETFNDTITSSNITAVSIMQYNKRIIRFGGYEYGAWKNKYVNKFMISSEIAENKYENIKWTEIANAKLPKPMYCDYAIYRNYLVIFGGMTTGDTFLDQIFLLDLNNIYDGWTELNHIKCPLKSQYFSVRDKYNNVHVFTRDNQWPDWENSTLKHYSISISVILGNKINKYNNFEERKCNECDELRQQLSIAKTEKISLNTLINELVQNQSTMQQEFKNEIKALKNKNIELNEECKEVKTELTKVKQELNKLNRIKNINLSNYLNWTANELIDWIISLEQGRYEKYENILVKMFLEEYVNGSVIDNIDKTDWRNWGVANFKDRIDLHKHVQKLINNNKNKQNMYDNNNEGPDGTPYI